MDIPKKLKTMSGRSVRTMASVAGALIGLTFLAAACSSGPASPGVASIGGTTTTDPSGSSSGNHSNINSELLAYSQCMQTHGLKDFPDPSGNGSLSISGSPGSDLNPSDPQFEKAQNACKNFRPHPTAVQSAQAEQDALKMSECMRAHGIKDFPDPTNGGIQLSGGPGSDLNPSDPQFEKAQTICQKYLPNKGKGAIQTHIGNVGPGPVSGQSGSTQGVGG